MSKQPSIYPRRRWLRILERGSAQLERAINHFSTVNERIRPYNPLYHLGTLAIFLLIVLLEHRDEAVFISPFFTGQARNAPIPAWLRSRQPGWVLSCAPCIAMLQMP